MIENATTHGREVRTALAGLAKQTGKTVDELAAKLGTREFLNIVRHQQRARELELRRDPLTVTAKQRRAELERRQR